LMKKKSWLLGLMAGVAAVTVFLPVARCTRDTAILRILCMGDSLTESEFGYYPAHLKGMLKKQGFRARVYSAARPGHNSGEYLRFLKTSKLTEKIRPHLVIILLGTNDIRIDRDHTPLSRYRRNMGEIIDLVRSANNPQPLIFLASIPPIYKIDLQTFDETSKTRVEKEIVPCIRNLARQEDLHYIDVHGFFLQRPELMAGIHPRKKGYYAMAVYIFNNLSPLLGEK